MCFKPSGHDKIHILSKNFRLKTIKPDFKISDLKMDFRLMPIELKKMIVSYMDNESTKNVALTSKEMKEIAYEKLWAKPKFKGIKDIGFLLRISDLPIRELNVGDFSCSWVEIVGMVPDIQLLHIDTSSSKVLKPLDTQLRHLRVPVIVHTGVFDFEEENFDSFVAILETLRVKEIIIDHHDSYPHQCWTFEQFKRIADKFHVSSVSMSCFDIKESNVIDYIKLLSKLKSCKVKLDCYDSYLFTIENLELMVKYNIRIVEIECDSLRTQGENDTLVKFAAVMHKMKHLEDFSFDGEDFQDHHVPPMELLTDLPFKYLSSYQFKIFGRRDVMDMARILSSIKSLYRPYKEPYNRSGLHLQSNMVSDYLFTPEDFALLKNLPLTSVYLNALDLKKDNIKDFRKIMKEMKIREIDYSLDENEDFEIDIEEFGPDGVYKTIKDIS